MASGHSMHEKAAYALSTARGVPIEYDLRAYEGLVRAIRSIDLSREDTGDLRREAAAIRERIRAGGDTDGELALLFALVAEGFNRHLGMRPFDAQLIAGIAMHRGRLVQMQTGEGKTLAAVFTACLRAMRGGGVHVFTANDYLAGRDAEWMRPVYELMGLRVASIGARTDPAGRRRAYAADVTYCTAREAGFDYLRDGLCHDPAGVVHRGFGLVIVDEADFILIDEARVPLVIAGTGDEDPLDPRRADEVARMLAAGTDYTVDREGRRISLLLHAHRRIETELGIAGIHEERGAGCFARIYAALHARELLHRDVDYIVKDGGIALVDELTGRVADRRQWPWGIQAALEAKEGVAIRPEGRVYGSITIAHLVSLYEERAAMTATAVSAAAELSECYGLATVIVPTVRPVARRDEPDALFATRGEKTAALVKEVAAAHAKGRPVLVGTGSVMESRELAGRLRDAGVACEVLNAQNDEREAELIAAAGRFGAVTISTNMAGRGTDIRLEGDGRVLGLGGLYVIGTNRHESRRVDDQLRGRAGRQGEPGSSRFFVSLEDPLFERYGVREFLPKGGAAFTDVPGRADPQGGAAFTDVPGRADPKVLKEIDRAQAIIEGQHHAMRRSLRKYSRLVELDRRQVRRMREEALLEDALPVEIEEALASAPTTADRERGPVPDARAQAVEALLCRLDRFWSDHLLLVEEVREGIHLVRYAGRDPGIEYLRRVGDGFDAGLADAVADIAAACARLPEDPDALRHEQADAGRPSSTWTYQVDDEGPALFTVGAVASSNIGTAALMAGPLLLLRAAASAAEWCVRRLRAVYRR